MRRGPSARGTRAAKGTAGSARRHRSRAHGSAAGPLLSLAVGVCLACTLATSGARAQAPRVEAALVPHAIAGLSFKAPADAEVTEQTGFPEGVAVVAVTGGDEVLLLTAYSGESAPDADKALALHTERVEVEVGRAGVAIEVESLWLQLLGRSRRASKVTWGPKEARSVARVVAARRGGVTVVAAWTLPAAQRESFSTALTKGLTLAR